MDGANNVKPSCGTVVVISLTAVFLLVCVYSGYFDFSTYTLSSFSLWYNVPQWDGDQTKSPASLWIALQSNNNNNNTPPSAPIHHPQSNGTDVNNRPHPTPTPSRSPPFTTTATGTKPVRTAALKRVLSALRSATSKGRFEASLPSNGKPGSSPHGNGRFGSFPPSNGRSGSPPPSNGRFGSAHPDDGKSGSSSRSDGRFGSSHPDDGRFGSSLPSNGRFGSSHPGNNVGSGSPPHSHDGGESGPSSLGVQRGGVDVSAATVDRTSESGAAVQDRPAVTVPAVTKGSGGPSASLRGEPIVALATSDAAVSVPKVEDPAAIPKPARAQEPSSQRPTTSHGAATTTHLSAGGQHTVSGFTDPYVYPGWWTESWRRSAVWDFRFRFVGDEALFPTCLQQGNNATWETFSFVEAQPYVENSKNPCWWETSDEVWGLRCLPYFDLAGVAKGGTTDLAKRLKRHPQVFAGTMKEYHWWERIRFDNYDKEDIEETDDTEDGMTFKWYTDKITGHGIYQLEDELQNTGSSARIFGDFSPSYLWDPKNWHLLEGNQNCDEPRVIVGQHIRHVFPQAKIILTFRHPTPRLYSRFVSRTARTHYLRDATAEDFHTYVLEGIQVYRRCFDQYSVRQCAYNVSVYHDSVVRLIEGMYSVFMADWLRVWPRENMLMLRYEDYGGHEGQRLAEIFDFLGLDPLDVEAMEHLLSFDAVNSGSEEYHKVGTMLNETKAALDEFYQPFIHQFAQLVQDRRFLWEDVSH